MAQNKKKYIKKTKNSLGIINVDTAGLVKPILILTGIGVIGFLVWQTRRSIQAAQKKQVLTASTKEDSAENYAARIKNAIGEWYDGTDEKAIFDVFSEIKTEKEFDAVQKAYNKLTSRILMEDLANELTSTEVETLMKNVQAKPTKAGIEAPDNSMQFASKLVELLKKENSGTCDYVGWLAPVACFSTDLDGIFHVFEMIPDKKSYEKVKNIYKTKTGRELISDLNRYTFLQEYASYSIFNSTVGISSNYNDNSGQQYIIMLQEKIKKKFGEV